RRRQVGHDVVVILEAVLFDDGVVSLSEGVVAALGAGEGDDLRGDFFVLEKAPGGQGGDTAAFAVARDEQPRADARLAELPLNFRPDLFPERIERCEKSLMD